MQHGCMRRGPFTPLYVRVARRSAAMWLLLRVGYGALSGATGGAVIKLPLAAVLLLLLLAAVLTILATEKANETILLDNFGVSATARWFLAVGPGLLAEASIAFTA